MMGRKQEQELYFMLSMFSSFTAYKRFALRGAGFFTLDRENVIKFTEAFATYIIIVYQFQPIMDFEYSDNDPYPFASQNLNNDENNTAIELHDMVASFLRNLEKNDFID